MKQYSFEKVGKSSRRNQEEARTDLPVMKHNLGLGIDDKRFDDDLLELITQVHLNILWYQKKIIRETKKRHFFFAASALLLLLLPVAIFVLATINGNSASTTIATQISALIAGLIAFQNVIKSWTDVRSGVGIFHEASAKLKKILFAFEHEWSNRIKLAQQHKESGFEEDFRNVIKQVIEQAIDIENQERAIYFEKTMLPSGANVSTSLIDAGKSAIGVRKEFDKK